jgi:hypothetical protein
MAAPPVNIQQVAIRIDLPPSSIISAQIHTGITDQSKRIWRLQGMDVGFDFSALPVADVRLHTFLSISRNDVNTTAGYPAVISHWEQYGGINGAMTFSPYEGIKASYKYEWIDPGLLIWEPTLYITGLAENFGGTITAGLKLWYRQIGISEDRLFALRKFGVF